MSLIRCSDCGADISPRAAACPRCGGPLLASSTARQNTRWEAAWSAVTGPASGKSETTPGPTWSQILLAIFAPIGLHRLLMGDYLIGVLQFATAAVVVGVIWCWIDAIVLLRRKLSAPQPSGVVRRVSVVCPGCKAAAEHVLDLGYPEHEMRCGALLCRTRFRAELGIVAGAGGGATEFTTEHDGSYSTTSVSSKQLALRIVGQEGAQRQVTVPLDGEASVIFSPGDAIILIGIGDKLKLVQNATTRSCAVVQEKWCFVATYLYGENSPEVAALRAWRDEVLRVSAPGRLFVCGYYAMSPILIRHAGRMAWFRRGARVLVDPIARRCVERYQGLGGTRSTTGIPAATTEPVSS